MIRRADQLDKSVELEEVVVPPSDPPSLMRSRIVQLLALWVLRDAGYSPAPRDSDKARRCAKPAAPKPPDNPHLLPGIGDLR